MDNKKWGFRKNWFRSWIVDRWGYEIRSEEVAEILNAYDHENSELRIENAGLRSDLNTPTEVSDAAESC